MYIVGYAKTSMSMHGQRIEDIGYSSSLLMSQLEKAVKLRLQYRTPYLNFVGIIESEEGALFISAVDIVMMDVQAVLYQGMEMWEEINE